MDQVSDSVEDLAGRRPSFDFYSTFRTRDTVSPRVLSVSPADDPGGELGPAMPPSGEHS